MNPVDNFVNSFHRLDIAIDSLFNDPKWKENIQEHFTQIRKLKKQVKDNFKALAGEGPVKVTYKENGPLHSRYIPGKFEFAMKYEKLLLERDSYRWSDYHKLPEVKLMLTDARLTLTYNPRTNDSDICTFLINTIKNKWSQLNSQK